MVRDQRCLRAEHMNRDEFVALCLVASFESSFLLAFTYRDRCFFHVTVTVAEAEASHAHQSPEVEAVVEKIDMKLKNGEYWSAA